MPIKKEYSTGNLTIVWQPELCIHSAKCVQGLPGVFKPKDKPWIQPEGVDTEQIKSVVDQCPSGALSYLSDESEAILDPSVPVKIIMGGPMIVERDVTITLADGSTETRSNKCSFCRCGASENKPYCDGSHRKIEFE